MVNENWLMKSKYSWLKNKVYSMSTKKIIYGLICYFSLNTLLEAKLGFYEGEGYSDAHDLAT